MKLPTVKINSDFHESYDHMFDVGETDSTWNRMSVDMVRRSALNVLQQMRLNVPYYDNVSNMYDLMSTFNPLVVVYTEAFAHRGEGKKWTRLSLETLQKHCNDLAMLYVAQRDRPGSVSYRYLRMGRRTMWLRYESDDEWRSNCGNVEITEISRPSEMQFTNAGLLDPQDRPCIAVDFVSSIGGKWWAVDFNTSPGVDHTPFTETYSPEEIVNSIKEWFQLNAARLKRRAGCPTSG